MTDRKVIQYVHPKWTCPKTWARIRRMCLELDRRLAPIAIAKESRTVFSTRTLPIYRSTFSPVMLRAQDSSG